MKETVITWTANNWITVFLMVFLMTIIVGFALKTYASMRGTNSSSE